MRSWGEVMLRVVVVIRVEGGWAYGEETEGRVR